MHDFGIPEIGPLIRQQRKARSLTLLELSAASGVSKSMLSEIERGGANPTLAVIWALSRTLGVDFAELLRGDKPPYSTANIELTESMNTPEIRSGDGLCRLKILNPSHLVGKQEWYALEIQPGGRFDFAPRAPGAVEHFTATTPGFEITSGDVIRTINANDTARYAADIPHCITNQSDTIIRGFLMVLYKNSTPRK